MNLEERINKVINSPKIELDGLAYIGKYELNNRKSIDDFLKTIRLNDNGKNKLYTNKETGKKIIISGNSAGKIAGHYKDGEIYQKTIAYIPEIIENMIFLDKRLADKENAKFIEYFYFVINVKMHCT